MPAPVRQLSARIVVNPAEIDETASRRIGRFRCRAEPHLVIESLRDGFRLLVVAGAPIIGPPTRQAAAYRLQFADTPIPHQFTRDAEILVGTLLAARLEDTLVLL